MKKQQILAVALAAAFLYSPSAPANGFTTYESPKDEFVVNADKAEYDGKRITLEGNARVEHSLGLMAANHIVLSLLTAHHSLQISNLAMQGSVLLTLAQNAKLSCDQAFMDFEKGEGLFTMRDQQHKVLYHGLLHDKEHKKIPLRIESENMQICISKNSDRPLQLTKQAIKKITANHQVSVLYNQEFGATADHAYFHGASPSEAGSENNLGGLIILTSDSANALCELNDSSGNLMHAKEIRIDTHQRKISMDFPKGEMAKHLTSKGNPAAIDASKKISFTADSLVWDDARDTLTLRNNIVVHQGDMGSIVNDREVQLVQRVFQGKKVLQSVIGIGHSELTSTDAQQNISHTLTCHGKLTIDHTQLRAVLESPSDPQGKTILTQQVHFHDPMGEMYADTMTVYYQAQESKLHPVSIHLKGNVYVRNQFSAQATAASRTDSAHNPFLQYAIADSIEYQIPTQTMTLKANKGKRVLFFDKLNHLQVSAPGLTIHRDTLTKKESIQGVGDVRFTFAKDELQQIEALSK